METRKEFLNRLRKIFGVRDRTVFLKRLRNGSFKHVNGNSSVRAFWDCLREMFSGRGHRDVDLKNIDVDVGVSDSSQLEQTIPSSQTSSQPPININNVDEWRIHVEKLKDVSALNECLAQFRSLLKKREMLPYAESVRRDLNEISVYIDKKFKVPSEINEETSEKLANLTGKFAKERILDLLRGCHNGIKHHSNDDEKKFFYENFLSELEKYLSSVGVYCKNISRGANLSSYSELFEPPIIKEAATKDQVGIIDEIEILPHVIPYINENNEPDEFRLRGICIAFGMPKK